MSVENRLGSGAATTRDGTVLDQRYLTFTLATESYAMPLSKVREVIALGEMTKVPNTPPYFKGIMNLRGQVISVIDLRVKFHLAQADISTETAIIILDLGALCLGVIIDTVDAVLFLSGSHISSAPEVDSSISTDYITGVAHVGKRLILILDIEKTLSVEELLAMKSHQATKNAA